MQVQVTIQRDEDGVYIASCPALRGCHSQGKTYEEALNNIKEAIELYIEHLTETNKSELKEIELYPKLIATEELIVAA